MAGLVPNAAEGVWMENVLNKTAPQNWVLKLYKNNYTPIDASVEGDFTEADFTGYGAKTLAGASWTVTPGAPTSASYAQQTFTSSVDQTIQYIYGYLLVQATSGKIMSAERFTTPYPIENDGDVIKVTPIVYLKKLGE
jgi:hypothetical protein